VQQAIVPNLWFDTEAEEAAEFYCSIFTNSKITNVTHYPDASDRAGMVLTVEFELNGNKFVGINGGPEFKFDEAVSFQITCEDRDEIDGYWEKLTADGGEEGMCGWIKDKYGLSWQVVPEGFDEALFDPDPERANRAWEAMMKMRKLDIAALRAAADGVEVS
jgi:predicted 3-demethylubiquinone-9 3-methyltransferase (glyoxalase superfamily)